jgi:hypothetical protein
MYNVLYIVIYTKRKGHHGWKEKGQFHAAKERKEDGS